MKYQEQAKFADKISLLVWCAIFKSYVCGLRSKALYSQRCIQNYLTKLVNFIHVHHAEDEIMFGRTYPFAIMPEKLRNSPNTICIHE